MITVAAVGTDALLTPNAAPGGYTYALENSGTAGADFAVDANSGIIRKTALLK